jgi:hypothetical protein
MPKLNKGPIKNFVSGFFGNQVASIRFITNMDRLKERYKGSLKKGEISRLDPNFVGGYASSRGVKSNNWRKALVLVNLYKKKIFGERELRSRFEIDWLTAHEIAHVYAFRSKAVGYALQEIFAELVALEYLRKTYPTKFKEFFSPELLQKGDVEIDKRMIAVVPDCVKLLHKYLPDEIRQKIIQDLASGKIVGPDRKTGGLFERDFHWHVYSIVKKLKNPPKEYLDFLEKRITQPL